MWVFRILVNFYCVNYRENGIIVSYLKVLIIIFLNLCDLGIWILVDLLTIYDMRFNVRFFIIFLMWVLRILFNFNVLIVVSNCLSSESFINFFF